MINDENDGTFDGESADAFMKKNDASPEAFGDPSEAQKPTENEGEKEKAADHTAYMPDIKPVPSVDPAAGARVESTSAQTTKSYEFERHNFDLLWVAQKVSDVRTELSKYVIGQTQMVDLLLTGIFANGHILLEGVPGVAKTLSAKVLSKSLNVDFSRIQFTQT